MADNFDKPWRVVDELIEQPSWGGRYIIGLKNLDSDPKWLGKKVGQSYELARSTELVNPSSGVIESLSDLLAGDSEGWLGEDVLRNFGSDLSLLIKLTQAKGNSFQVHLPEGKTLGHWKPKPEAWFYLAPGLFTFGIKPGADYSAFSSVLQEIDMFMHGLSESVQRGELSVDAARAQAHEEIARIDPYQFVQLIEADTDDVVDLTPGGIHHSWEEDDSRYPDGNLVYEVQVDVPDEDCSMRGFDKGKILGDGSLRASHVQDYLATIVNDDAHNDIRHHISKPSVTAEGAGWSFEKVFRTPYFNLDRVTIQAGQSVKWSGGTFQHLFVLKGSATLQGVALEQGASYVLPARGNGGSVQAQSDTVLLLTYLPLG